MVALHRTSLPTRQTRPKRTSSSVRGTETKVCDTSINQSAEWQRPAHSHSLTASQAYEKAVGALLDLRPVSSQGCSPHTHIHPGIHLWLNPVPLGATETIDVVSFVFAEDLSEVDKRAFEFAALQFAS